MRLLKVIDGWLKGALYLMCGICILGIPISLILLFCNMGNGLGAIMLCLSALIFSSAVTLLVMPKKYMKLDTLASKRYYLSAGLGLLVLIIAGITCLAYSEFPNISLLFI